MRMKWLAPLGEPVYALWRIVTGFLFAFHGAQKLLGLWSDSHAIFGTQIWWGGLIELAGGTLVLFGWWTRPAAFLCSGEMAVAYVQFHWRGRFGADFFPAINHGELAVLYCWTFLLIACRGAGRWGLDRS